MKFFRDKDTDIGKKLNQHKGKKRNSTEGTNEGKI